MGAALRTVKIAHSSDALKRRFGDARLEGVPDEQMPLQQNNSLATPYGLLSNGQMGLARRGSASCPSVFLTIEQGPLVHTQTERNCPNHNANFDQPGHLCEHCRNTLWGSTAYGLLLAKSYLVRYSSVADALLDEARPAVPTSLFAFRTETGAG